MSYYTGMKCVRCEGPMNKNNIFDGCPHCRSEGINVNFTTTYNFKDNKVNWPIEGEGFWKYKSFFAIDENTEPITLQEGNTPLIHLKKLGKILGLNHLYIKDETRNPTWSYKDRLCSVAVTRAVQDGAKVITISSTGNHGASAAAYAAAAGIPCVVFTLPNVPETMKTLMQSYGAYVIAVPEPNDRLKIMKDCVEKFGWVPISGYVSPPIGSNPYGIDGYKTIAFEIYDQMGDVPDYVGVPTAYGDGLYGIWKGFKDLHEIGVSKKLPRMYASEIFGSLKDSLSQDADQPITVPGGWSKSFSIATGIGTYQSLHTLRDSNGLAEVSIDEDTMEMQQLLSSIEGIYGEAASLTPLVAIRKLKEQGKINTDDKIVSLLTSTGLKDTVSTAEKLPVVKVIEPELAELRKTLKDSYNYSI